MLGVAGRIIAEPRRETPSTVEALALAHAAVNFWEICEQAERLAALIADPEAGAGATAALADAIHEAMRWHRGEATNHEKENEDGQQH